MNKSYKTFSPPIALSLTNFPTPTYSPLHYLIGSLWLSSLASGLDGIACTVTQISLSCWGSFTSISLIHSIRRINMPLYPRASSLLSMTRQWWTSWNISSLSLISTLSRFSLSCDYPLITLIVSPYQPLGNTVIWPKMSSDRYLYPWIWFSFSS